MNSPAEAVNSIISHKLSNLAHPPIRSRWRWPISDTVSIRRQEIHRGGL